MTKTLVLQKRLQHLQLLSVAPTPLTTCRIRVQRHLPTSPYARSLSRQQRIRKCTTQIPMRRLCTATIELLATSSLSSVLPPLQIKLRLPARPSLSPTSQSQELMLETTRRTPAPRLRQRSHKDLLKSQEPCRHKTRCMTVLAPQATTLQT